MARLAEILATRQLVRGVEQLPFAIRTDKVLGVVLLASGHRGAPASDGLLACLAQRALCGMEVRLAVWLAVHLEKLQ